MSKVKNFICGKRLVGNAGIEAATLQTNLGKQLFDQNGYAGFFSSLRALRRIFPMFVLGSSVLNSTCLGTL